MSSNRLTYDSCSYKQSLKQSVAPINYNLDPIKYEHSSKCRMQLGVVGGTNVSHIQGNLVDLENNLRGQTYPATRCSQFKYEPNDTHVQGKEYIKPITHPKIDTTLNHLDSCQLFDYHPVPNEPKMTWNQC